MYPIPIQNLIKAFGKLPSVGQRTAERYVFYLLKSGRKNVGELAQALNNLSKNIQSCNVCWDFSDKSPCAMCSDPKREKSLVCVVSEPQNVQIIEKMKRYKGLYHILRGTIKTDDPEVIENLKVKELFNRIKESDIKEIILALNPDLNGETTMMFLKSKIKEIDPSIKITRLARGLPMGSDLQYADEITLEGALTYRTEDK
jgi:recombination protein RecR